MTGTRKFSIFKSNMAARHGENVAYFVIHVFRNMVLSLAATYTISTDRIHFRMQKRPLRRAAELFSCPSLRVFVNLHAADDDSLASGTWTDSYEKLARVTGVIGANLPKIHDRGSVKPRRVRIDAVY